MSAPTGKYLTNWFVVLGVPCYVVWNADGWLIHIGGQVVERDCDVFSPYFLKDLDRQINEYEKEQAELMAEPI